MNVPKFCAAVGLLLLASLALGAADDRVHLLPKFSPGDTLRYRIETRLATAGRTTSPIENPEGASQLKQTVSLVVRLDVLSTPPAAPAPAGSVRLRATYEKSSATSETDAYDPQAAALEDQYNRLEGHSIDFTIEPGGKVSDIKGLDEVLPNPSAAQAARGFMAGLSPGAKLPKAGISIGQRWSNEQPLAGTPLANLVLRTESNYLRNEPCAASSAPPAAALPPSAAAEMCAVILTRSEILHHGGRNDATPEDYRRNGLRTSGSWTGTGESLDSISLSTGLVVRSTQTNSQEMDYEVVSAASGSRMTYKGRVHSESEVTLLPPSPAQP
ncbi:MAG TPA: hypothetical protein VEG64_05450 [Candidatus Sulfotelmatobacter sp.]|nr:hypothetical protein [Candidatus Sulfotelmatobacter sp.]